jgi:hypothetical protein
MTAMPARASAAWRANAWSDAEMAARTRIRACSPLSFAMSERVA